MRVSCRPVQSPVVEGEWLILFSRQHANLCHEGVPRWIIGKRIPISARHDRLHELVIFRGVRKRGRSGFKTRLDLDKLGLLKSKRRFLRGSKFPLSILAERSPAITRRCRSGSGRFERRRLVPQPATISVLSPGGENLSKTLLPHTTRGAETRWWMKTTHFAGELHEFTMLELRSCSTEAARGSHLVEARLLAPTAEER